MQFNLFRINNREGLCSENEIRALERLAVIDNNNNKLFNATFTGQRTQAQFSVDDTLSALNLQTCKTAYEDLKVLVRFAVTCMRALDH